jgi:hypothetical protein
VKIIACIEDPAVIERILEHLHLGGSPPGLPPPARAPPGGSAALLFESLRSSPPSACP